MTFCHCSSPNLSELLLIFKNHSPFGCRACFQFPQLNCEDFDPSTVDEQQQDVFLMQKMFSRQVQILETITLSRPLIHLRHNSYRLEQSVSTPFDIDKAWSEASKKVYISGKGATTSTPQYLRHNSFIVVSHMQPTVPLSSFYCKHNAILLQYKCFKKAIDNPAQRCHTMTL